MQKEMQRNDPAEAILNIEAQSSQVGRRKVLSKYGRSSDQASLLGKTDIVVNKVSMIVNKSDKTKCSFVQRRKLS